MSNTRAGGLLFCLLCTALLGTSCKTYSSRQVYDLAPTIARLQSGVSVQQEVDRLVEPLIESGEIFGACVGVLTPDGVSRTYEYGRKSRRDGAGPPREDTIFQVGSLSKVLISAVLARLVEEGVLRYDDTVRGILPPEVKLSPEAANLTLYELATHTAGLPRQPIDRAQLVYFISYLFTGRNLYGYIDRAYLYEYLENCHLKPKAERTYIYSNIGAGLLAHLIEVKTGRSVPDLVAEKICRPLNMRDTVYVLNAEQRKRLAEGHAGDQPRFLRRGHPISPWDMGEIMGPSGGLYSTVGDLMIFAQANLGLPGCSLDKLLASTQQPQLSTPAEDVALGWLINHYNDGRRTILFKHGMVSGYYAYVGLERQDKIAVAVLCNSFNWDDKIGHNLVLRLAGAFGHSGGEEAALASRGLPSPKHVR